MTRCPICGEEKERVAQHWAMSGCGHPEISQQQRALLDGLVLSRGTIAGNGSNRHLTISSQNRPLIDWVADQLDWLVHVVRREQPEDRSPQWRLRTPAHPAINRYERWHLGDRRGRNPPEKFQLHPLTGRVWWSFGGGLEWSGPYDSQRQGGFSAEDDRRASALLDVLDRSGFKATRQDKRVRFSPTELEAWLEWIGEPAPGVEYKWAESLVVYRTLRDEPRSEEAERVAFCQNALEVAAERTDQRPLTAELFENRVEAVSASEVADALGGGGWSDAVRATLGPSALEDPDKLSAAYPHGEPSNPEYSEEDWKQAIREAVESEGEPLKKKQYEEWRQDHDATKVPTASTISHRIGWTEACESAGVTPSKRFDYSTQDLVDEILRIRDNVGDWPTISEYMENRCDGTPSRHWIYEQSGLDGWAEAVELAKRRDSNAR